MSAIPPLVPKQRRRRTWRFWFLAAWISLGLAIALLGICLLGLGVTGTIKSYTMPTGGMEPTVPARSLVFAVSFFGREPQRGQVVVFSTADIPDIRQRSTKADVYCQRLVGLPGDVLTIKDGNLLANGAIVRNGVVAAKAVRLNSCSLMSEGDSFTVPPDQYFMMGDNYGNSFDSRYWGPLPKANLRHRVVWRWLADGTLRRVE